MLGKSFTVTCDDIIECKRTTEPFVEINGQINENALTRIEFLHEKAGVTIHRTEIGPDGYVAPHKSYGVVNAYIVQGSGIFGLMRMSGEVACEVFISEGDMITYEEDAPEHFYKAGKDGMVYVAIVISDK